jgi:hypothetical protein
VVRDLSSFAIKDKNNLTNTGSVKFWVTNTRGFRFLSLKNWHYPNTIVGGLFSKYNIDSIELQNQDLTINTSFRVQGSRLYFNYINFPTDSLAYEKKVLKRFFSCTWWVRYRYDWSRVQIRLYRSVFGDTVWIPKSLLQR